MKTAVKGATAQETLVSKSMKQVNYEKKLAEVLKAQQEADAIKKAKQLERTAKAGKPGIIATIFNTIVNAKKPVTKTQILDVLLGEFKSEKHTTESMMKTINAQLGNTRPNRMEREKSVIFDIVANKEGLNTYSYSE